MKVLLIIGGDPKVDWFDLFKSEKLHGQEEIKIDFAQWDELQLVSFSDSSAVLDVRPSDHPIAEVQRQRRTVLPNFVVVRGACRGVHGQDWRNALLGLMHANVPSINSLESLYLCQEKPVVYGRLLQVQRRLGREQFPLVEQTYYAGWRSMNFSPGFPLVMKVGTAHAGFGKMRVRDQGDFEDFRSVCALQDQYVVAEPFVDWDYDFRIQKIGNRYRAFKRYSTNWKGRGASQRDEDVPMTEQYRKWVDEAASAVGMDMCALDGVHSKSDGREFLLELNDSAFGFVDRHQREDMEAVRDLVLLKLAQAYPLPASKPAALPAETVSEATETVPAPAASSEELLAANRRLEQEVLQLHFQLDREQKAKKQMEQEIAALKIKSTGIMSQLLGGK